jgi:Fe-S oxidoreductase
MREGMKMASNKRTSIFIKERCDLCGLCLHHCPVLSLPLDEAREEIQNLIEGQKPSRVLVRCNSCMSCNLYCPHGANPYQLILERWNDLYLQRGAPPIYRFVCPTEEPNIWQLINVFLSEEEQSWISQWMKDIPEPDDEVLLIGNYTHLFPFIIGGSSLLDYFKPIDRIDHWEGGAYLYQGGYLDLVKEIAERTRDDFDTWGIKTVITPLEALHYIFTVVHPREMGVEHEQTFVNLHDWLLNRIVSAAIRLPNRLGLTVTVHDNCYSKVLGGAYWDTPRKILRECGCEIKEMAHNKRDALCCGFGAGASWVRNISIPFDIISEGAKKFEEAEKTGADALVSYCSGCIYLLWATRELLGSKLDVYHSIEIVRMAMGEQLNYPRAHIERAWDVIAIITYQLLISTFQRNFKITKLAYDSELSTFSPKKYRTLRFIRRMLNFTVARKLYAGIFRMLMPVMKTR